MPIDASIALEAGKPTNPLGQNNQTPNYLANPQALNALLQMSGQMAAGKALQQSIGPDGNIDFQGFANTLANNPQAAPYAFQAMNQGLDAAGKQLQQQITRRQQGASLITPLLLDPEFTQKNPEYAQKELQMALTKGVQQGTIDNKTAIYFSGNLPTQKDSGGKIDVDATRKELVRALVSTLPPEDQQKAVAGQVFGINLGNGIQYVNINPITSAITPIGPITPYGERQATVAQPIPGTPTARGEATAKPLGSQMPMGGETPGLPTVPNITGAPPVPGQAPQSTAPQTQPRSTYDAAGQVDAMMKKPAEDRTKWWNGLNAQQKQQVRAELARRAQPQQ